MIFKHTSPFTCMLLLFFNCFLFVFIHIFDVSNPSSVSFDTFTEGREIAYVSIETRWLDPHRTGVSYPSSQRTSYTCCIGMPDCCVHQNHAEIMSAFAREPGVSRNCVPKTVANMTCAHNTGAFVKCTRTDYTDMTRARARCISSTAGMAVPETILPLCTTKTSTFATCHCLCPAVDWNNVGLVMYRSMFVLPKHILFSVLGYVAGIIKPVLVTFTPLRSAIWPPHIRCLNSLTINGCFTVHETVIKACKRLKADLLRCVFRNHDFAVFRASMCNVRQFTMIFVVASHIPCVKNRHDTTPVCVNQLRGGGVSYSSIGGGRIPTFSFEELRPYIDHRGKDIQLSSRLKFVAHNHRNVVHALHKADDRVYGKVPLNCFVLNLTQNDIKSVAKAHGIHIPCRPRKGGYDSSFENHSCPICETHLSVFVLYSAKSKTDRNRRHYDKLDAKGKEKYRSASKPSKETKQKKTQTRREKRMIEREKPPDFPPPPPSVHLKETIVRNWCKDTSPEMFAEGGCAVCGQLTPLHQLSPLSKTDCDLDILNRAGMGFTRLERTSNKDPIMEVKGPVIDADCTKICRSCENSLAMGLIPKYALANGLWLGRIPPQLQNLSYAEQLLVSRVRHSKCIVQVSSGMRKMKANAIMFENPMPKIYRRLPPPVEELDEVLAFIYTGPCRPTEKDMERTPLLVRRNVVGKALEWLRLNHVDYRDLDIAYDNLEAYPDNGPPVVVTYRSAVTNKVPEAVSAFDNEDEEGVDSGPCPFVVNGITGEKLNTMGPTALAAKAVKHLKEDDGKILAIGHAEKPESMYDNPQLYPMMFPWLFPYGLGGIGCVSDETSEMSDMMHKRKLLMYHDKRFQMDPHFPLIAFNQEQIKKCITGGYLLTERRNFDDIAERLMNLDMSVLEDLSKRLERGDRVKPVTDEEKACYAVISDIDHVAGHVQGSITSKKYLRNEIWSLISYTGAPSWFITFAPADNKHPICLYHADTKETFSPDIRPDNECYRLIANNPVASARFFHFMVQMFIKHVLGVDQDHPGLYGDTSAYYGTVEQQGRLTLHLHLLLWISGCFTPQELRDKIMDVGSDFQKCMVEYLESLCVGQFLSGSKSEVSDKVDDRSKSPNYRNPTLTLPVPPEDVYGEGSDKSRCEDKKGTWWKEFEDTVDDLLLRSNQHTHKLDKDGNNKSYCATAKGECKRRFPRDTFEQTLVDPKTGALNLKKGEAWMNTITPVLTYLLRCNSDVTSLLSGTAIKAIVAYVSDYITKPGLKTYSIFDVIKSIFDKNSEMIGGDLKRREKVRKIFTQVVNSLTTKLEIGGPMASLYVLGNPDHYTGHIFVPFYWRGYVKEVLSAWSETDSVPELDNERDKVVINKSGGQFIGVSRIGDYVFRPSVYDDVSLYDWVRLVKKSKKRTIKKKRVGDAADDPEFDVSDDELNIGPKDLSNKFDDKLETDLIYQRSNKNYADTNGTSHETGPGETNTIAKELGVKIEEPSGDVYDSPLTDFIDHDIDYLEGQNDEEDDEDEDELDIMDEIAENIPKKDHSFQYGHPQSHTHQAKMQKENPLIVPNFLPNTLPRSDRGDREYYCCAMLTFFKPWRTGKDLKTAIESWDKSFVAHIFSKRQLEIMKYFKVRYECLDARDDYSAKRDKEGGEVLFHWATSDVLAGLDDMHDSELAMSGADFKEHEDMEDDTITILGRRGRNRVNEMMAVERTMRRAGWLDDCIDGLPDVGSLEPIQPEREQPAKAWRSAVLAKKQAVLDERNKHLPTSTKSKSGPKSGGTKPNTVEVVDQSYIDQMFRTATKADGELIVSATKKFLLNKEQERAFRIIANHATIDDPEQLRMYLGGMGGTGKSQVIKALMSFFDKRKENHRFIVVAPTGAAAALLNGSTYHSVLGISDGKFVSTNSLAQIRARLDGVDYIFLDEVSMISCRDMYKISAQAAKARAVHDQPFGGINFVFAGDFAQLPPARSGPPLYSGSVGTQVHSGQTADGQESAVGKALWHQVTTVVILRQNMRQATQSDEDAKLRTSLENMRYRSCTAEDIAFLRTRIAGKGPNDPKLAQKRFRNVSIITGRNSERDKINELGCERFAYENNQTLTSFYSIDRWKNPDESRKTGTGRPKKTLIDPVRKTNVLSPGLQRVLWEQPPASSNKHVAGKLDLCIGMPVMLKHNDATECCITKGAEATVVSWQTVKGPEGQLVLDTLFVELKNPPKTVKIEGLPDNVVPITRHATATVCYLPNDDEVSLSRDQVLVLPNFAMTDYSSQGRTRPDNPVDLNSCQSHQSYYTCLSRSATAAGTIIVQGFDPKVVTGGASGYLRQEFRQLELLDEVTRLRYEGTLPTHVTGNRRNTVIRQFQEWKGADYVPDDVHHSIRWTKNDPLDVLEVVTDSPWQIIQRAKKKQTVLTKKSDVTGFVAAKGSIPVSGLKRKMDDRETVSEPKRIKACTDAIDEILIPRGLVWDNENYSCAYDSVLTVLLSVWMQNPSIWKNRFADMNRTMKILASGFHRATEKRGTLESARNKIRRALHQRSPTLFPYGQVGTPVSELVERLLRSDSIVASTWLRCVDCEDETNMDNDLQTCVIQFPDDQDCTTSECLQKRFQQRHPRRRCAPCGGEVDKIMRFDVIPKVLVFSVQNPSVKVSKKICFRDGEERVVFVLRGIVYFGDFHYTARVCVRGSVWFHDGMGTGKNCTYEKELCEFTDTELSECRGKILSQAIYSQH